MNMCTADSATPMTLETLNKKLQRCFVHWSLGPSAPYSIQDPAYGLRQLVDIALHGLAVGAKVPTTASQAIDHLADLLVEVSRRPAASGHFADQEHQLRLVLDVPCWSDYVDLASTEISQVIVVKECTRCNSSSSGHMIAGCPNLLRIIIPLWND